MTATAIPLAWVPAMIFPTSASMAAPLGIACPKATAEKERTATNSVNPEILFPRVRIGIFSPSSSLGMISFDGPLGVFLDVARQRPVGVTWRTKAEFHDSV